VPRSPGKVTADSKGKAASSNPEILFFLQSTSLVLEELKPSHFKKKKILYL